MSWTLQPIAHFPEFAAQWDVLVRSRPGTPFLESAFLQAAIDTFGSGEEQLCLYAPNGKLCAAAILQRSKTGLWQTFQPSQLPLGAWISSEDCNTWAACGELLIKLPGLALGIGLSQLDSRIHGRQEDSARIRSQDYIQTAWVNLDGSFDAYWDARGKNLKQNTRKQRNKLHAEGTEARLERITAADDIAKAIEDYGALESAGWKTADGTAVHPDNLQGHFYRTMLESFCRQGRGSIYRYWFGDKVVAMDLCIHDSDAIIILKTTYDESYKAVSPSTLMRQAQFEQLFEEQKFNRIEFYGKVMEWHTRWTDNTRAIYHANVYRHGLVLRLLNLRHGVRKAANLPLTNVDANHA